MKRNSYIALLLCSTLSLTPLAMYSAEVERVTEQGIVTRALHTIDETAEATAAIADITADATGLHDSVKVAALAVAADKLLGLLKDTLGESPTGYAFLDNATTKAIEKIVEEYINQYITSDVNKKAALVKFTVAAIKASPIIAKMSIEQIKNNPVHFIESLTGGFVIGYITSVISKNIEKVTPKTDSYTLNKIRWVALKVLLPVALKMYGVSFVKTYFHKGMAYIKGLEEYNSDKSSYDFGGLAAGLGDKLGLLNIPTVA